MCDQRSASVGKQRRSALKFRRSRPSRRSLHLPHRRGRSRHNDDDRSRRRCRRRLEGGQAPAVRAFGMGKWRRRRLRFFWRVDERAWGSAHTTAPGGLAPPQQTILAANVRSPIRRASQAREHDDDDGGGNGACRRHCGAAAARRHLLGMHCLSLSVWTASRERFELTGLNCMAWLWGLSRFKMNMAFLNRARRAAAHLRPPSRHTGAAVQHKPQQSPFPAACAPLSVPPLSLVFLSSLCVFHSLVPCACNCIHACPVAVKVNATTTKSNPGSRIFLCMKAGGGWGSPLRRCDGPRRAARV